MNKETIAFWERRIAGAKSVAKQAIVAYLLIGLVGGVLALLMMSAGIA